jgi:hypothetical protein
MDRIRRGFMVVRMRMIVMLMVVIMLVRVGMFVGRVGLLAVDHYTDLAGADAAPVYGIEAKGCAEVERSGGLLEEFGSDASVDQGAEEHVSADAGKAFEIANTHGCFL